MLDGLAKVSFTIYNEFKFNSSKNKKNNNFDNKYLAIQAMWTHIMTRILHDSSFSRNFKNPKKFSIAECAYQLLSTLILNDLIELPCRFALWNLVLGLPGVSDPMAVDAPHFFLFVVRGSREV